MENGNMASKQPYDISYDQGTKEHLRAIEPKYHSLIRAEIEEQLQFEPAKETRNRKPLRQPAPFGATWEIRFGPNNRFRVLYDIDREDIHERTDGSDDGFLYCRGFIVGMGRAYYEAVLADPDRAVCDAACEEMCYLSWHMHHDKFGEVPGRGWWWGG